MDNFVLIYTYTFKWHFHGHEYLINPGHRTGLFFTKLDYVPFLLIFHWNIFLVIACFKLKQPLSKGGGRGPHAIMSTFIKIKNSPASVTQTYESGFRNCINATLGNTVFVILFQLRNIHLALSINLCHLKADVQIFLIKVNGISFWQL